MAPAEGLRQARHHLAQAAPQRFVDELGPFTPSATTDYRLRTCKRPFASPRSQAGLPASIQRRRTATRWAGHGPSHGILPASRLFGMASACVDTSSRERIES